MARAIEQLKQAMEVCELGALTLPDQIDALMDAARAILQEVSTLTQPNEPLTCEGCIHEHNEHENCYYCQRASYLGDYYYRRPPEGEEEKKHVIEITENL